MLAYGSMYVCAQENDGYMKKTSTKNILIIPIAQKRIKIAFYEPSISYFTLIVFNGR